MFKFNHQDKTNHSLSLVPSLPAKSYSELESLLTALSGTAPEMQVDIVDGRFVPHRSWPFTEPDPGTAIKMLGSYANQFSFEIDCMVLGVEKYLEAILAIPADRIIIHFGSTDHYHKLFKQVHRAGAKVGLALAADIELSVIEPHLDKIDFVQLMGIREVGRQGQPFAEETFARVKELRTNYPELEIAVDGGVNENNIPDLIKAGANRLAPGSAIAKQSDPKAAYLALKNYSPKNNPQTVSDKPAKGRYTILASYLCTT